MRTTRTKGQYLQSTVALYCSRVTHTEMTFSSGVVTTKVSLKSHLLGLLQGGSAGGWFAPVPATTLCTFPDVSLGGASFKVFDADTVTTGRVEFDATITKTVTARYTVEYDPAEGDITRIHVVVPCTSITELRDLCLQLSTDQSD